MKRFASALIALSLVAGAANAAGMSERNERPDATDVSFHAEKTVEVTAYQVLSSKEQIKRGVSADTLVKVSDFSVSGKHNYER